MRNNYKYSLKRRISAAYISVYAGICVLIILSFVVGCGVYVSDKCRMPSDELSEDVADYLAQNRTVDAESFREFLYEECILYGISEVFVFNTENEILVATGYTYDNEKYFSVSDSNVILRIFPGFAYISDEIYVSERKCTVDADGVEYDVKIIMYHSIDDELAIFLYLINMSLVLMLTGVVLFVAVGTSSTRKMLSPIKDMTEVAKRISGENMDERFELSKTRFELYELAMTINSMMDRISESYDRQKRFVSDVSHELRTPISVISGYAGMLRRWGKDDEEILEEGIDNIIQEAETMSELVQTLLFLARHDNETLRFEPADVDVSEMVLDIVRDAQLAEPDAVFTSDIAPGVYAYIDEARVRQALRVFIDNAIKYTLPGNRRIFISLVATEDSFEIGVTDNGIGISGEELENVFERFYRTDESRTRETGGYGLGLSIAKVIVLSHGGKIRLRSRQGSGSTFALILPYRFAGEEK